MFHHPKRYANGCNSFADFKLLHAPALNVVLGDNKWMSHPDIDFWPPVGFALKDLGCSVRRGSAPSGQVAALGLVVVGEPKVGYLHVHLRVEQKVLGFEVTVNHLEIYSS